MFYVLINLTTCKYRKWFQSIVLRNMVVNTNNCSYKRDVPADQVSGSRYPVPESLHERYQHSHHHPQYQSHSQSQSQSHSHSQSSRLAEQHSQHRFLPETYNDSWYVKEGANRRSSGVYDTGHCWPSSTEGEGMVGAYVSPTLMHPTSVDRDTRTSYGYRAVVVNVNGDSAVVRSTSSTHNRSTADTSYGWCSSGAGRTTSPAANAATVTTTATGASGTTGTTTTTTTTTATTSDTSWIPWCRPAVFLLVLVLLVLVFVLISGILLYFNCTYT